MVGFYHHPSALRLMTILVGIKPRYSRQIREIMNRVYGDRQTLIRYKYVDENSAK